MDLSFLSFRFRIDNTDHILDVNVGTAPNNYDIVNIFCPFYDVHGNHSKPGGGEESFVIYAVSKDEYATCRIRSQHPRVIAKCDTPRKSKVFTITFRSFSPTPGALEFTPGKDYHFVSTSSAADLHQRVGGACRDNNMKVVFKVADPDAVVTKKTPYVPVGADRGSYPYQEKNSLSSVNEENEEEKRRRRKKKRRQRKKSRTRGDAEYDMEHQELPDFFSSSSSSSASSSSEVLNDNPNSGGKASKVLEKELSLVEKVNNLMKQEASVRSGAAAINASILVCLLILLVICC